LNRLQICLLLVHTVYIVLTIIVFFGRYSGSQAFSVVFANVLVSI
jgi:hypothetical protein